MNKLILIGLLLFPVVAQAQTVPQITNVVGTVANGQSITVQGLYFGPNGPTVILFDDFEGGTNGTALQTNLAEIGSWYSVPQPTMSTYSNINRLSGNLAARFDIHAYQPGQHPVIIARTASPFNSFYISWGQLLPSGNDYPGHNAGGENWKWIWVTRDDSATDADVCFVGNASQGAWTAWFGNDYPLSSSGCGFGTFRSSSGCPGEFIFPIGTWNRFQMWQRGSTTATGEGTAIVTNSIGSTWVAASYSSVITLNAGDTNKRQQFNVNGYVRETPNSYPTFDDVYIATGEYAQSRVEIGNAPTYAGNTRLTMCTTGLGIQGWSDTSVTCTVRAGSFTAGQTGYVYVTKADGTRNATGYGPVTFSASGGPYTITASIGQVHGSPAGTIDGVTTPVSKIVSAGTTTTFTITPSAGSHIVQSFIGGTCGGTLVGNTFTTNAINSNCTVIPVFTQIVTPSAGANGSLICTNPVPNGEPSTCTAQPNGGYHTSGISSDVCGGTWVSGDSFTTGNVTQDCTVTATFASNEWLVTPSWGAHGTVSPTTSQTVANNGSVSFTITPDSGYYTSISLQGGCTGYGHGGNIYNFGPVTANCQFTASFLPLTTGGGGKGKVKSKNGRIRVTNGALKAR